jgi:hypothetical protein
VIGPRWGVVNPMVQPNGHGRRKKINRVGATIHKKQNSWHAVIKRVTGLIHHHVIPQPVKKPKNRIQKIAQKVIRHAVLTVDMWVDGKRLVGVKTPSKNINEPSIMLMRLGLKKKHVVLPVSGRTCSVNQIATRIVVIGVTWCNRGL